jgi:hypothetical protein
MMTRAQRIAFNKAGLIQWQHLANPFTAFCPSRQHKKLADAALVRDLDVGAALFGKKRESRLHVGLRSLSSFALGLKLPPAAGYAPRC